MGVWGRVVWVLLQQSTPKIRIEICITLACWVLPRFGLNRVKDVSCVALPRTVIVIHGPYLDAVRDI